MPEHPTPEPREHPEGPPREKPSDPPTETPERPGRPPRTADGTEPDPTDGLLWKLTYRSAEVVAELMGELDVAPPGTLLEPVLSRVVTTTGRSRSTIRNTLSELVRAGALYRSEERAYVTPLGRSWAQGAIDPKISPLPRLILRDDEHGLRLVWQRPKAETLEAGRQQSNTQPNPTEEVTA